MYSDMILCSFPIDIEPLALEQRAEPVGQQRFVIGHCRVGSLARFIRASLFRIFCAYGLCCGLRGIGGFGSAGARLRIVMPCRTFSLPNASEGIFSVRREFSVSRIRKCPMFSLRINLCRRVRIRGVVCILRLLTL